MSKPSFNRRSFLAGTAATTMFTVIPRHVLGTADQPSANNRLNIAAVGVGGMGSGDIRQVPTENIVAICDVDSNHAANAAKAFPQAKVYADFRQMLDTQKEIDAVMVATPDHNHAVVTMMALKLGKHVFCQKPLTHSVHEALEVAKAAKEAKVATQMGNQGQASEAARLTCELIWAGAIGNVREIHGWSNRRPDISPRGIPRPSDTPACPSNLNWDLWLGPAPERPYHPCYHPFAWRGWWDFGTGRARRYRLPQSVGGLQGAEAPLADERRGLFDALERTSHNHQRNGPCGVHRNLPVCRRGRSARNHASLVRRRHDAPHARWCRTGRKIFDNDGTLIVGDKGLMLGHRLLPESRNQEVGKPPEKLPRSPGHYQEWINACKGGPPAGSNFVDHAGPLAAVVLMGNIAIRTQEKLEWDPEKLQFKNSDAANALLSPPYRAGWVL